MPSRRQGPTQPPRGRKPPRRSVARPVRDAAARAVEKVLRSEEAFALLISRLEAAGWHVERGGVPEPAEPLPPPSRSV
jgi:hypothetical protein